jgi:hypothetical protein
LSASRNSTALEIPSVSSVAAHWACFNATKAELESRPDAPEEEWDVLDQIEKLVLCGPIQTKADAIAKLRAAERSVRIGERYDGADWQAIADVTHWLEAH